MIRKVGSIGIPPDGEAEGSKKKDLSPEKKKASRIGRRKAKEAEDLYKKPAISPLRRKSFEYHDKTSPEVIDEDKAIEEKEGALWRCWSRKPAIYGGYIYTVISKGIYVEREKWLEIFPAIEPFVSDDRITVLDSNKRLSIDSAYKPYEEVREYLFKLGYKYDASLRRLYLPDQEALESGWKKLQEELPDLPDLDLLSGDGIASNIEFIEAYLTHDALLSSGKEFLHDHIFHVLPTLFSLILPATPKAKESSLSYVSVRAELREQIKQKYRRIMLVKREMENNPEFFTSGDMKILKDHFAQIEFHLGAITDTLAAEQSIAIMVGEKCDAFEYIKAFFVKYDSALWHPLWSSEINKKFGKGSSAVAWIERLHKLCDDVIEKLNDTRERKSKDK